MSEKGLEFKIDSFEKKLDIIATDIKELVKIQGQHATDNAVNKSKIEEHGHLIKDLDERMRIVESKQTGLITKVSVITSTIVLVGAALLNKLFK